MRYRSQRDELLNETLFLSMDHARVQIAAWVEDYNHERPHSAFGYETPAAFAAANCISNGLVRYALPAPLHRPLLTPRSCAIKRSGYYPSWWKAGCHVSLDLAQLRPLCAAENVRETHQAYPFVNACPVHRNLLP